MESEVWQMLIGRKLNKSWFSCLPSTSPSSIPPCLFQSSSFLHDTSMFFCKVTSIVSKTFENTISPNTFFLEANSVQLRLIEAIKHKSWTFKYPVYGCLCYSQGASLILCICKPSNTSFLLEHWWFQKQTSFIPGHIMER